MPAVGTLTVGLLLNSARISRIDIASPLLWQNIASQNQVDVVIGACQDVFDVINSHKQLWKGWSGDERRTGGPEDRTPAQISRRAEEHYGAVHAGTVCRSTKVGRS